MLRQRVWAGAASPSRLAALPEGLAALLSVASASATWAHPKGQRSLAMTRFDPDRGKTPGVQVEGSGDSATTPLAQGQVLLVLGHGLLSDRQHIQWMERQSLPRPSGQFRDKIVGTQRS